MVNVLLNFNKKFDVYILTWWFMLSFNGTFFVNLQ